MSKKVTTILAANETTAAPAAKDFVVDGDIAKISLQVFELAGSTPTIALSVIEMIDKGFTLGYDAQTVNFTVGRTLVGRHSNARGLIMDDTDNLGAVAATTVLTLGANASNGDIVTLDTKVYTFQATLTDFDGNVHIGATASDTIDNLIAAINLAGPGLPDYADAMTLHPTVSAVAGAGDTMDVTAKIAGAAGNTIVSTTDIATSSFTDTTMAGGEDDSGATGTLELKRVVGTFFNNEPLGEEIAGVETSGAAVADGILTRVLAVGEEWAAIGAGAVDAEAEFINPDRAAAEAGRYDVYPRRFRLITTEGGSWTAADFAVDLIQNGV